MKKSIILILIILLFWFHELFASNKEEYKLNSNEIEAINKLWDIYLKKFETRWDEYKNSLIESLDSMVGKLELWSKNYQIIYSLIKVLKTWNKYNWDWLIEEKIEENVENTEDNNNEENTTSSWSKLIVWWDKNDLIDENLKINFSKVKETWVWWQNEERWRLWLSNYYYDDDWKLEKTAQEWADVLMSRWTLNSINAHKRDLSDSYYNYNKIAARLKDRWVECKNDNRVTFSESIARTSYYCPPNSKDCTYEFIEWLRKSFDKYLEERERTESSRPHYNAIINRYFKRLWLWLAVREKSANNYEVFITTHYCTELVK